MNTWKDSAIALDHVSKSFGDRRVLQDINLSVAPGEAITLQFMIPPSEGTFQLNQLRLNVEGVIQGRVRQTQLPFTMACVHQG